MENQHRKISGYRELTQEEIDLMNEAKELEAKCLALHNKVKDHLVKAEPRSPASIRADRARASVWHCKAIVDIETGFMALVRSIAQPQPRD